MQGGRDSSTCADGTIKITLILLCLHRRVIDVCREQDRQMQGYFLRRESPKMTFGILRLGDAVQRWLRHPEPSSWSFKSARRRKVSLCFFAGRRRRRPLQDKTPSPVNSQKKNQILHPLFLLHIQAQKKKLSKRKRRNKISHSAERDKGDLPLTQPPFKKGGRKL